MEVLAFFKGEANEKEVRRHKQINAMSIEHMMIFRSVVPIINVIAANFYIVLLYIRVGVNGCSASRIRF